mmetsp:Transcript_65245/g.128081  ORF Transcript_65245/g.128081 Transcript_65245/m.128081 type:complete len:113 (+) Transcript_65245:72-410(+)
MPAGSDLRKKLVRTRATIAATKASTSEQQQQQLQSAHRAQGPSESPDGRTTRRYHKSAAGGGLCKQCGYRVSRKLLCVNSILEGGFIFFVTNTKSQKADSQWSSEGGGQIGR